ncbi:MAG: DUF5652 family protein [Candidatus Adlerbacteria bacterium]|nr:DUF5652 family protein [Candidatus Adlerbacteria bacterium]
MYTHHYGMDQSFFINLPFWSSPLFGLVAVAALWSLVWKGLGLWHASRNGQPWWFMAIFVVNTAGILEIFYLFFVAKLKFDQLFTKGNSHAHVHPHHDHTH